MNELRIQLFNLLEDIVGQEKFCDEEGSADYMYLADQILALVPQWISVEDRLPEDGDYSVWVAFTNGSVEDLHATKVKMYHVQDWVRDGNVDDLAITHWMPLPQPPKE